jgi:hypothetical protein
VALHITWYLHRFTVQAIIHLKVCVLLQLHCNRKNFLNLLVCTPVIQQRLILDFPGSYNKFKHVFTSMFGIHGKKYLVLCYKQQTVYSCLLCQVLLCKKLIVGQRYKQIRQIWHSESNLIAEHKQIMTHTEGRNQG